MMQAVDETARRFFQREGAAYKGKRLLVGVSGGPDSVCLLLTLHRLKSELKMRLHVAHLHHGLRGAEADADARYVSRLSARLGVACTIGHEDVEALRKRLKLSLEEAGRLARRRFFARVAHEVGASAVALGHTADDQVETVLLRLVRGTGITGLRGMLSVSEQRADGTPMTLLRPLLTVRRQQTEAYCRSRGVRPRQDPSNREPRFLRNRIRHELLPLLRRYNPAVDASVLRLARLATADTDALTQQAHERLPNIVIGQQTGGVRLDAGQLDALPLALQRYVLREALSLLTHSVESNIEAEHVDALMALLRLRVGSSIDLPGAIKGYREYSHVWVGTEAPVSPWPAIEREHHLNVPGQSKVSGWRITARYTTAGSDVATNDPWVARLDAERAGTRLWVRSWRPGDRFHPLGMKQPKKLHDFFVDEKVPREWRRCVPLLCDTQGIVWVAGYRISERCKVTPHTRRILLVRAKFRPMASARRA
ncbi:MAG: tRNA lysidine(34) synthetase TilS [Chloroflexi bacterium]|nr:tRNA lysidine(34) synthetase TilS [Chloroflexota bacterium]